MSLPIKDAVLKLHAYTPGEQPSDPSVVKLNTNENPYPPAPQVLEALAGLSAHSGAAIRKYPPATADPLRDEIGQRLGFSRDQIIIGYGSDELLRLLCQAVAGPERPIACLHPTYSLYPVLAEMYEAETLKFDEQPPAQDEDAVLPEEFVRTPAPLVFLANPNPPYGTFYPLSEIERLCAANPNRLVVVDEAYVDFAPTNALPLLKKYSNLAITRTFSKSYSLAGMRVGFAIAAPELIAALMALKDSYNLPIASQAAARAAWDAQEYFEQTRKKIIKSRSMLGAELANRGLQVYVSHGNFVFALCKDAKALYEALKRRKVLIRYWDYPPVNQGVRITVGTDKEIERLVAELDSMCGCFC
ncbi:MAG: histidinol-phosphate transaminase [Candidatus Sumerlaeota bacterium]|nr:histidinol-phosphate transaminase [Candidatus Sumerlaeota bacterium]